MYGVGESCHVQVVVLVGFDGGDLGVLNLFCFVLADYQVCCRIGTGLPALLGTV